MLSSGSQKEGERFLQHLLIMVIFVTAIILIVLMSLTLYLHLAGAFNTVYPGASQVAVYILLACIALTIGVGIFYSGPTITSSVGG